MKILLRLIAGTILQGGIAIMQQTPHSIPGLLVSFIVWIFFWILIDLSDNY